MILERKQIPLRRLLVPYARSGPVPSPGLMRRRAVVLHVFRPTERHSSLSQLLLLLLDLEQQSSVDVWQDTTKRDGRADQCIQLLVSSDRELQVARRDTLHFEILGGVASKLEYFGRQVFEDCGQVDGGFGADARLLAGDGAEMALYAAAWELRDFRVSIVCCFWWVARRCSLVWFERRGQISRFGVLEMAHL